MNKKVVGRCRIYIYLFYLEALYERDLEEPIESKVNYYNLIDYYICYNARLCYDYTTRVYHDLCHSCFILFRHIGTEDY